MASQQQSTSASTSNFKISLSSEQFFQQDSARGRNSAPLGTVLNLPHNFGLKHGHWKSFDEKLKAKNAEQPERVEYVLIYLARHGQGYHNIGEAYVGSGAWRKKSTLSPQQAVHKSFPDARLTPVGTYQADVLSTSLQHLIQNGLPWPQAFYTSPLHRALQTGQRTWGPIASHQLKLRYEPQIYEMLRERLYIEDCNQRSTRSEIKRFAFPRPTSQTSSASAHTSGLFKIPRQPGGEEFKDHDYLYQSQVRLGRDETDQEAIQRAYDVLSHIFHKNWNKGIQYISITTHVGFISAFYQLVGLAYADVPRLSTGSIIPILVKVEKVHGSATVPTVPPRVSSRSDGAKELKALEGKQIKDVLAEIRDEQVYKDVVKKAKELRKSSSTINRELWDKTIAEWSPVKRVIAKSLF